MRPFCKTGGVEADPWAGRARNPAHNHAPIRPRMLNFAVYKPLAKLGIPLRDLGCIQQSLVDSQKPWYVFG